MYAAPVLARNSAAWATSWRVPDCSGRGRVSSGPELRSISTRSGAACATAIVEATPLTRTPVRAQLAPSREVIESISAWAAAAPCEISSQRRSEWVLMTTPPPRIWLSPSR